MVGKILTHTHAHMALQKAVYALLGREMTGESTTEKIREERRGGVGHIPFSNKFPKTIVCIHFNWELGIFSSSCLKWRERETFEST